MKWIALGLAIFGCVATAYAADEKGYFAVIGAGNHSCGKYLDAVNKGNFQQDWGDWNSYAAYTAGYLTGLNEYRENTNNILGSTDLEGVMANLEIYCKKHPMKKFMSSLGTTARELYPSRKQ